MKPQILHMQTTASAHNYRELHKGPSNNCRDTTTDRDEIVIKPQQTADYGLFMAHCRRLYDKITQPSDKLVVIDSASQTSAPAAAGMASVTLYWL